MEVALPDPTAVAVVPLRGGNPSVRLRSVALIP